MILRRFTQALKEQNWTAITIEFVLLVLGVFLGIQVGNWNQQRGTAQQAQVFTDRLMVDLREENWRARFLLAYHRQVLANANRAATALEGQATLSDEELLVSAYRATQYKEGIRRRSTYDELIATGNIGLVRDPVLRDTAMRVFTTATYDNMVREGQNSQYRIAFRRALPNDVQRAISRQCGDRYILPGDYTRIQGVLDYPCATGLPPEVIAASAQALRSDLQLRPALRLRIADIETRLFDVTSNQRQLWEALERIAGPQAQAARTSP